MKKRFFYWMFVAIAAMSVSLMSLTSCSRDDNKDADPVAALKGQIVGSWELEGKYHESGDPVGKLSAPTSYEFQANGSLQITVNFKLGPLKTWSVLIGDKKYIVINGQQQPIRMISDDTLEFVYDESNGDFYRFKKAK
ncbi:hypothetical protein HMPREF6745_0200 [Prevotella sp. oral taxon 472 str. F0295]|nr:hypothetical protein [Prevotella sp. oral taxon 472]EEX54268.1 hypothetical protein HMPREF6745_0200 [Prevotella sp. oral taxon 472 str. F0295]